MKTFKMLLPGMAILMMVNCVFAQTWTQTSAPTNNWVSVASSADGRKLIAAASGFNGGVIYVSSNSGGTWLQTSAPSNFWSSVASSADGNKLAAAGYDQSLLGVIFTSDDSGTNWTQCNAPNIGRWSSIASSSDGNKLAAITDNSAATNSIYISTNAGVIWTQTSAPITNWMAVASSADGTKLVAVVNNTEFVSNTLVGGPIYISTNSGTAWRQSGAISGIYLGWQAVASSADGTKLAAVDLNHIFTSTDSGMTWTQTSAPHLSWSSIASSADGKKIIAGTSSGNPNLIYTSTDSGATWTSNNISGQSAYTVTSAADGNKLVAASSLIGKGQIYTAQTVLAPQLNLSPSSANLTLSWIVPSTNFVLQQSSDLQNWTNTAITPMLNLTNLQEQVILSPTNGNGFYRLKTP